MRNCQPLILLFVCSFAFACAATHSQTPADVVASYASEVPSERDVWLLEAGNPLPWQLDAGASISTISHRATWVRPGGSPIVAQHIDGVWRLTSGVLLSESAATPEQAVVLFTRAVREADPVLLLALLPDAERLHWSEERAFSFLTEPSRRLALIALLKGLKPTINLSHRPADAARVVLGDARGQIVLDREEGGWKIADLRPHSRFLSTRDGAGTGD